MVDLARAVYALAGDSPDALRPDPGRASTVRREPVLALAIGLVAVFLLTRFGVPLDETGKDVVNVLAVLAAAWLTRRHVTPNAKLPAPPAAAIPPAAGATADIPEQGTNPMNTDEFVAAAKAKANQAKDAIAAFFEAHPDLESDAADALKKGAEDLGALAQTEIEQAAPKSAAAILDDAVLEIRAKAESAAAAIKADAETHAAALEAAKAIVAPAAA